MIEYMQTAVIVLEAGIVIYLLKIVGEQQRKIALMLDEFRAIHRSLKALATSLEVCSQLLVKHDQAIRGLVDNAEGIQELVEKHEYALNPPASEEFN